MKRSLVAAFSAALLVSPGAAAFTFSDGTHIDCVAGGKTVAEQAAEGDAALAGFTGKTVQDAQGYTIVWNMAKLASLPPVMHDYLFFHECAHAGYRRATRSWPIASGSRTCARREERVPPSKRGLPGSTAPGTAIGPGHCNVPTPLERRDRVQRAKKHCIMRVGERKRPGRLYDHMKAGSSLAVVGAVAALTAICIGIRDAPLAATIGASREPTFDRALVVKGSQLAAIGNCAGCHTRPGGKAYAGGLPMQTPFGTIYSTNITPDVGTGIGGWSSGDFLRAMHEGIDREGRNLYPAFPYDHFTRVTDDDVNAIYAFVMTREPVQAVTPPNRLMFPMNFRPLLSAWNALFFERGVFRPDPGHNPQWNRGAYLVDGLGHCGACHTPRNALGAEKKSDDLGGGEVEGWHATALNAASPSPSPWTVEQMFQYLRQGWDVAHGTAAGPMQPVVHDLSEVAEEDVRAISAYLVWAMKERQARRPARDGSTPLSQGFDGGAAIFEGACASCHEVPDASTPSTRTVPLAYTTSLNAPDPRNAIHIVLDGIWPEAGEKGALMPGFDGALTPDQLAALMAYLRVHFTDWPAWQDTASQLRDIRERRD